MKRQKVGFLILIVLGTSSLGVGIWYFGFYYTRTEETYIFSSNVDNWTQIDTSIALHTRIYFPFNFNAQKQYPTLLLFHGLGRDLEDNDYFARKLTHRNFLCICISFRGHGQSNGTFTTNGSMFASYFPDALGAYRYARNQSFVDPDFIFSYGSSLGGAAAIFLGLQDLVQGFIAWYPAIGIEWHNQPLSNYTIPDSTIQGLILAGTKDTCNRCLPEFNEAFISKNPQIQLNWLQGAEHTDSRFFLQCVSTTLDWLSDF
jgi:dienelactone hydrolase